MAHTNETSNYALTQFIGSDKPSWLNDYNGDNLKIDTAIKNVSDQASDAYAAATAASSVLTDLGTRLTTAEGNITQLNSAVTSADEKAEMADGTAREADHFTEEIDGAYKSYSLEFWAAYGYITSNSSDIFLFIDLPKMFNPLENPKVISLNVLNIMIKGGAGNMIPGSSTYVDLLNNPDYTVAISKAGDSQLRIKISGSFQTGYNNCPVVAYGTIGVEIA